MPVIARGDGDGIYVAVFEDSPEVLAQDGDAGRRSFSEFGALFLEAVLVGVAECGDFHVLLLEQRRMWSRPRPPMPMMAARIRSFADPRAGLRETNGAVTAAAVMKCLRFICRPPNHFRRS